MEGWRDTTKRIWRLRACGREEDGRHVRRTRAPPAARTGLSCVKTLDLEPKWLPRARRVHMHAPAMRGTHYTGGRLAASSCENPMRLYFMPNYLTNGAEAANEAAKPYWWSWAARDQVVKCASCSWMLC